MGTGTPRCRSAGTHLVEVAEIHGDAEGRSAGSPGEGGSAGAKLRRGGGAGGFIDTGAGAGPGGGARRGASRTRTPQRSPPGPGLVLFRPAPGRDARERGPPAAATLRGVRGMGVSAEFSRLETEGPGRELGRRWGQGSRGN